MATFPYDLGVSVLKREVPLLPETSGIYQMRDDKGDALYVGKAKNLRARVTSYTRAHALPLRLQRMLARLKTLDVTLTRTEAEALILEATLIQKLKPPYNILFRDDKSYPYIRMTRDHAFPALAKHRGSQTRKGWYFGPFADVKAVDETLCTLQRGFQLRTCTDTYFSARKRPCLHYHMKRCSAPCVGRIDEKAYAKTVADARAFLRGEGAAVLRDIATAMENASDAQDYERAAVLRDRLRALSNVRGQHDGARIALGDCDVIGVHADHGMIALHRVFVRGGRINGGRTVFATLDKKAHDEDAPVGYEHANEVGEALATWLGILYQETPAPPRLLLSTMPADADVLAEALSTRLDVPDRSDDAAGIVEDAQRNAREALARRLATDSTQRTTLKRLQELLGLAAIPQRIEVYDNSHSAGKEAVGAFIVATPDGFDRKAYRRFRIQEAATNDDFGMMREVLTRRFRRLRNDDPDRTSDQWPDLLIIDGGLGQVNAVRHVLDAEGITGVALMGMAKGEDRNAGRETFIIPDRAPFNLPTDDPLLWYLQRLRDEAHRSVIGAHRARRTRDLTRSQLDEIAGVGARRRRALIRVFGSVRGVAQASVAEIAQVPGISVALATKIRAWFDG